MIIHFPKQPTKAALNVSGLSQEPDGGVYLPMPTSPTGPLKDNPVSTKKAIKRPNLGEGISYTLLAESSDGIARKPHRFRVWNAVSRRHTSGSFTDYEKGAKWARDIKAGFAQGVQAPIPKRGKDASKVLWRTLGDNYVKALTNKGSRERYIRQVSGVVDEVEKEGARSITDPNFPKIIQQWLDGRKLRPKRRVKVEPAIPVDTDSATTKEPEAPTEEALSPALKHRFLMLVKAICQRAVGREGGPATNPLAVKGLITLPKVVEVSKAIFKVSELRTLLSDKHKDNSCWLFAVLAAYTGYRATEVRNLTWANIDFESGHVVITPEHPGNKAKTARRTPLQGELRAILEGLPKGKPSDFILPVSVQSKNDSSTTMFFQRYVASCGLDSTGRGPHALRHTCAALLTALNMNTFKAMKYLGHKAVDVAASYAQGAEQVEHEVKGWTDFQFQLRPATAP